MNPNPFNQAQLRTLLDLARREDLGEHGDITTRLLPDADLSLRG